MRPIQVYLDSSDFSDIVNVNKKSPEYLRTMLYLTEKRDSGLIKIRFSEAHVVEASAKSPDSIDSALERLRAIQSICGNNSLIHPIDLIEFEVSSPDITNPEEIRGNIFRNDGSWLPSMFDLSELVPDVEALAREEAAIMGREAKRKYWKDGKPTPRWYEERRASNSVSSRILADNLPLTSKAVRIIGKYFMGESSRMDALTALKDSVANLDVFGNWYKKDWESASAISKNLRLIGVEFETALSDARKEFNLLEAQQSEIGVASKTLLKMTHQAFYEVLAESSNELANDLALQIGSVPKPTNDPWVATPGLTCSVTLAMNIARRSIAAKLPRNPKPSDFPDCYHAVYLPYVDVFRADSFIAGMLQECKLPFPTLIVDNFLKLPEKIDDLLGISDKNI